MSAKWLNKERASVCLYYDPSLQIAIFASFRKCLETSWGLSNDCQCKSLSENFGIKKGAVQ